MQFIIPQHVSITENPSDETSVQIIGRQEKFVRLEKKLRYKLASYDTGQKIKSIGQKYQFEIPRLANITRLIREYYFGEVRLEDFPREIEQRMGVNLLTAQEITRYIKQEIIDWDPWGQYLAKLPTMSVRSIIQQYPHIADMEITSGYVELRGSDDLSDPSIKNWIHDYVLHVGQGQHAHMEQTEYLFHSENAKNLSSPDREKLGIILKSFDENIPLPVDEESREIVFDSVISEPTHIPPRAESRVGGQRPAINNSSASALPKPQTTPFIKPYAPVQQRPEPQHIIKPNPVPQPQRQSPPAPPEENFHPNLVSLPNRKANENIDKIFNTPESRLPETPRDPTSNDAGGEIPGIRVHSITERNVPPVRPQAPPQLLAPRPVAPSQPMPPRPNSTRGEQESAPRPKYRIIDPFSAPMTEPRINGNIVDLSNNSDH